MTMLLISRQLATRLLGAAQAAPHCKVCGLIGGRDGQPLHHYPVANAAADPATEFRLDSAQRDQAEQDLHANGEELLGVYHSHPATPPLPSASDLQACGDSAGLLFVISLNTKGVLEMRAFEPTAGGAAEVPLQVFF